MSSALQPENEAFPFDAPEARSLTRTRMESNRRMSPQTVALRRGFGDIAEVPEHVIIDGNNLLFAMYEHAPVPNIGRETLVRTVERWARNRELAS